MKKLLCMNLLVTSFGASLGGCGDTAEATDEALIAAQSPALTSTPPATLRATKEYSFTKVAAFGETTPSGGQFQSWFLPHGINDRGDVFFESYSATSSSLFRMQPGHATEQFAGAGLPAPGGGHYGEGIIGLGNGMNQNGDAVFRYLLDADYKDSQPYGLHSGVFRVDAGSAPITLVRPGTTLAPSGKPFLGAYMYSGINSARDVVFAGFVETTKGIKVTGEPYLGIGSGVYVADAHGSITSVVSPGDPAPKRGVFDFAENAAINDHGDVAFGAHIAGETCNSFGMKQAERLFCAESVYLYRKSTGRIVSIAHQGESAPGGGTYALAFGPVVNSQGDVVYIGDFSVPPAILEKTAVYLWSHGSSIAVARPGDAMPGGGHMVKASGFVQGYSLNDRGEVFFFATLDTDKDKDGKNDNGVFAWKDGTTRLIVRTGNNLPGIGTVSLIAEGYGFGSAVSNNHGEVLMYVTTTAGNGYLVKASPR